MSVNQMGNQPASNRHIKTWGLALWVILVVGLLARVGCGRRNSDDPTPPPKTAQSRFLIRESGKFGFIDRTGQVVIRPQFDIAGSFAEDVAPVQIGQKWGYIDRSGTIVINPQFDDASGFSDGRASVTIAKKQGFIDHSGRIVINPEYDSAYSFSDGLARVQVGGGLYGYIDTSGRMVISPQFGSAKTFSEGLAEVGLRDGQGFIDHTGNTVIGGRFGLHLFGDSSFHEGLASVNELHSLLGYIDRTGKFVIAPEYVEADPFSEGLAAVNKDARIGYIDRDGRIAITPQFEAGYSFHEGLASAKINGKFGFIDKTGKWVINPLYDSYANFKDGLALVRQGIGNDMYIDATGQTIWHGSFEAPSPPSPPK